MVVKGWYFSDESRKLRYDAGREIAIGVEHTVKGYPEPCKRGLHASERILDALQYAPGPIIWRVELSGRIKRGDDKVAATRRKYIAGGLDISDILRKFARKQALSVAHLWDIPEIVRRYLEIGDEFIRAAAWAAAWAAAKDAASDAAWAAARAAAWAAASDAASDAARAAAWAAASDAAWAAAWAAARAAAWAAASDAAWAAARDAASDAAWAAARAAARAAAGAAAGDAAWAVAHKMLEDMVLAAIGGD
jgi:hypothetical protein